MSGRRITLRELAEKCRDTNNCGTCLWAGYCDEYEKWMEMTKPYAFADGIDTEAITFTERGFRKR